jgi:hypothetical protein
MTTSIWKYPLETTDEQEVKVPKRAIPLCVQVQGGVPCLWARVDPKNWAEGKVETLIVRTHGTGHPIDGDPGQYLGTYQLLAGGAFVGHVFWSRK